MLTACMSQLPSISKFLPLIQYCTGHQHRRVPSRLSYPICCHPKDGSPALCLFSSTDPGPLVHRAHSATAYQSPAHPALPAEASTRTWATHPRRIEACGSLIVNPSLDVQRTMDVKRDLTSYTLLLCRPSDLWNRLPNSRSTHDGPPC